MEMKFEPTQNSRLLKFVGQTKQVEHVRVHESDTSEELMLLLFPPVPLTGAFSLIECLSRSLVPADADHLPISFFCEDGAKSVSQKLNETGEAKFQTFCMIWLGLWRTTKVELRE